MGDGRSVEPGPDVDLEVARAQAGEADALEAVVRGVQPDIYRLAVRFLWHPQDAEDASQEILIRIITGLGTFKGDSSFRTWVYRVACNTLISLRKKGHMERRSLTFDEFRNDLAQGLSEDRVAGKDDPNAALLLEEIKIGCTLAMLQCLDRLHRMAYILGDIVELDHQEAAQVLVTSPAVYRKRLSRARSKITSFMMSYCGLVNPSNSCRCRLRVAVAVDRGRVDPANLLFACSAQSAKRFPKVLEKIRELERHVGLLRCTSPIRTPNPLRRLFRG